MIPLSKIFTIKKYALQKKRKQNEDRFLSMYLVILDYYRFVPPLFYFCLLFL